MNEVILLTLLFMKDGNLVPSEKDLQFTSLETCEAAGDLTLQTYGFQESKEGNLVGYYCAYYKFLRAHQEPSTDL